MKIFFSFLSFLKFTFLDNYKLEFSNFCKFLQIFEKILKNKKYINWLKILLEYGFYIEFLFKKISGTRIAYYLFLEV